MNNILEIKNISKKYHTLKGEIKAIENISLKINKGEFIGIVGSSGCGKSTLLNIISGLDKNYEGTIIKDNIKLSYMLQTDALLPYLTVLENSLIGLKLEHNLTKENITYVKNLIKKFGLENFINQKPENLSGGMKQRVLRILYTHGMIT